MAFLVWAASGPEGGVRVGIHQMEPYAQDYIAQENLVDSGETIVCYYDASITLDASELVILTDRRLIHVSPRGRSEIALEDVLDVRARDGGVAGHIVDVTSTGSTRIHVEVAPFNGGEVLEGEIRDAVKRAQANDNPG